MKIIVWGMGYVGTTAAASLAKMGHDVVGVETHPAKLSALQAGRTFLREPRLAELVKEVADQGSFRAVGAVGSELLDADLSLICVGTPSAPDGSPVLDYIERVGQELGSGLRASSRYHVIALRCTVPPGTARSLLAPLVAKHSGKALGADFGLAANPEFLREGTSLDDFFHPPYTLIGQYDARSGDVIRDLYAKIEAPLHTVSLEEAELIKMVNNAFHALKIGFANEVGRLCNGIGLDAAAIMDLVCRDTKLNISPTYLRPGFAFGGSCLPKDLRSLAFQARHHGLQLPIIEAILPSNDLQVSSAVDRIYRSGAKSVAILGLSFKENTDDLRESPVIPLVQRLWAEGIGLSIYDPDLVPKELTGANLEYSARQLPQLPQILKGSLSEALRDASLAVVTKNCAEFEALNSHPRARDGSLGVIRLAPAARARKRFARVA